MLIFATCLFVFITFTHYISIINGEIINNHYNLIYPLQPAFFSIPKFSASDVPHSHPGNGKSFIDLNELTFALDCRHADHDSDDVIEKNENKGYDTTFEIMIFESSLDADKKWIDYWPAEGLCCTDEMITLNL